jgi:four helix bundle protein
MERGYLNLKVYQKAFQLAMDIFELTKSFPVDERYALTDQIKRSSRSVASCIAEAYRKRQYEAYFVSKVSDVDMENTETQVWLDFALASKYIEAGKHAVLMDETIQVGRMLNHMMENPKSYQKGQNKK